MVYRFLLLGVVFWLSSVYGVIEIPENIRSQFENAENHCRPGYLDFITMFDNGDNVTYKCLATPVFRDDLMIENLIFRPCHRLNGTVTKVISGPNDVHKLFCVVESSKNQAPPEEDSSAMTPKTPERKPCDFYTGTGRFRDCVRLENCEYEETFITEIQQTDARTIFAFERITPQKEETCEKPPKQCSGLISCESEKGFPSVTQVSCETVRDSSLNVDVCPSVKDCFTNNSLTVLPERGSVGIRPLPSYILPDDDLRRRITPLTPRTPFGEVQNPNIILYNDRRSRGTR